MKKSHCDFSSHMVRFMQSCKLVPPKPRDALRRGFFHSRSGPKMTRLQTLKPRLAVVSTSRVQVQKDGARANGEGSTARGYNYRWQKARARFLRDNPLCVYCQREGRVTAATVVDHIVPHRGDQQLFWDENNWNALCASCHSSVKQKEENAASRTG